MTWRYGWQADIYYRRARFSQASQNGSLPQSLCRPYFEFLEIARYSSGFKIAAFSTLEQIPHLETPGDHPDLRRFMQPDPIGYAAGLNLYAYVGNSPLNATDPYGDFALTAPVIIVSGMFAVAIAYYATKAIHETANWHSFSQQGNMLSGDGDDGENSCSSGNIGESTPMSPDPNDDDETLQSRGHTITNRTAKHFGRSRREVGRALEDLKKFNGYRRDYHQFKIMKSGNVIDKKYPGEVIDNLWTYMH